VLLLGLLLHFLIPDWEICNGGGFLTLCLSFGIGLVVVISYPGFIFEGLVGDKIGGYLLEFFAKFWIGWGLLSVILSSLIYFLLGWLVDYFLSKITISRNTKLILKKWPKIAKYFYNFVLGFAINAVVLFVPFYLIGDVRFMRSYLERGFMSPYSYLFLVASLSVCWVVNRRWNLSIFKKQKEIAVVLLCNVLGFYSVIVFFPWYGYEFLYRVPLFYQ